MTVVNSHARAADFDDVYSEHYAQMAKTAFLLLGNSGEAEEVTQEAFTTLFQRWDTIDNPPGFVRTAIVNRSRDIGRRRTTKLRLVNRIRSQRSTQSEPEFVLDVLQTLDLDLRELVVLRFYADLTIAQIAQDLGIPEGTVKSKLHKAIGHLKRDFNDEH